MKLLEERTLVWELRIDIVDEKGKSLSAVYKDYTCMGAKTHSTDETKDWRSGRECFMSLERSSLEVVESGAPLQRGPSPWLKENNRGWSRIRTAGLGQRKYCQRGRLQR